MAQPSINEPSTPEHGARINAENARQGQRIKGMVAVLAAGLLLVAIAYTVMLSLAAQPAGSLDPVSGPNAPAAVSSQTPGGPAAPAH